MLKNISRRELIKNFRKLGFNGPYSGSKHEFMKRGYLKIRIPSPHKGDISAGLVNEILKQAGISKNIWNKL